MRFPTKPMDPTDTPIDQLSFAAYRLAGEKGRQRPAAFISLAHWFEAEKFRAFQPDLFEEVMLCPSIKEARKLATKSKNQWRGDWLAVRVRALACGMVYASRSEPMSTRWHGSAEEIAKFLAPLGLPERFLLGAATEYVRLRNASSVAFLGANSAPHDIVGKRINLIHKKAERAWTMLHWQGRHGCWRVHDWAVSQYIPVVYAGEDDARVNAQGIAQIGARCKSVVVFEKRGGKAMDATIRALRLAKVPVELDLYLTDKTEQIS